MIATTNDNMETQFLRRFMKRADTLCADVRKGVGIENLDLSTINFSKPQSFPERDWSSLNQNQRYADLIRRCSRKLWHEGKEWGLTERDYLRMAYPEQELSELAIDTIKKVLSLSLSNERNPTLDMLISSIGNSIAHNKPINIVVSQCLSKAAGVRQKKFDYFPARSKGKVPNSTFVTDIETKGWQRIKNLLEESPYPMKATILLGDMDILTIDGASEWAEERDLIQIALEVEKLEKKVNDDVKQYFNRYEVEVKKWSSFYGLEEFRSAVPEATDLSRWINKKLITDSFALYEQYGYRKLQISEDIPEEVMTQFILGDVVRTAAQYKMEAKIIKDMGAIQGWAESVPNRIWPVEISNYDGSGYLPSILMV